MAQSETAEKTLEQIQHLVERLDDLERERLLDSLTVWIDRATAAAPHREGEEPVAANDAWEDLFELGDALAEADRPAAETLTSAVLRMRR